LWRELEKAEKSALDEEELEKNTYRYTAFFRPPGKWDFISKEVNIPKGLTTLQSAEVVYNVWPFTLSSLKLLQSIRYYKRSTTDIFVHF
jgi:hypothetical protein